MTKEWLKLRDLILYRELLWAWTMRTVRARYQQSALGALWAVAQPLATVAIFTIVFTLIIPVDTGEIPYPVFSYTAMVPWFLFATSLTDMTESLVTNISLVTKIYFPREILPAAAMLARLVDAVIAALILVILMLFYRVPLNASCLFFVPLILGVQLTFMLGLGLGLSALNVFYRDIRHLLVLVLQLWLYATPIIYPVTLVPEWFRPYYFFNPMAGIIESYRAVLLYGEPPGMPLLLALLVAIPVFGVGYWYFRRVEYLFADAV